MEDRPCVGSGLLLILFVKLAMSELLMTWERMFGIREGTALSVDSWLLDEGVLVSLYIDVN